MMHNNDTLIGPVDVGQHGWAQRHINDSPRNEGTEVQRMSRRCRSCGAMGNDDELAGGYCWRCDKIAGDVMAGLKMELEG